MNKSDLILVAALAVAGVAAYQLLKPAPVAAAPTATPPPATKQPTQQQGDPFSTGAGVVQDGLQLWGGIQDFARSLGFKL